MLKPQDVVVVAKLIAEDEPQIPIHRLAATLSMSPSEVHHAVHRAADAGLLEVIEHRTHAHEKRVIHEAFLELCITGLKYVFPAVAQTHARGLPTGWAAPALMGQRGVAGVLPPVWPTDDGAVAGLAITPLYRCVPAVAERDPRFYAMMAAIDAIRARCTRSEAAAKSLLTSMLTPPAPVARFNEAMLSAPTPAPRTSASPVG